MARLPTRFLRVAVLVVLLLALRGTIAFPAQAAPGIDVVVLVDQSGSMWGHPRYHPQANDRGAFRIQAVKEIVERLAADVEGSTREHRISIFSFDRQVVPYRQDLRLRFDPSRPGEALVQAQAAMRGFDEVRDMQQPWTNTPAAYAEAVREFARLRAAAGGDKRHAHLLLITDGRPYLEGVGLAALRDSIRRSAQELRDAGVQLWVLGINDADNYWMEAKDNQESDGEFWEATTGDRQRASRADTPSFPAVQRIVARFVDGWLERPSNAVVVGQPFVVPPFQRRVIFTANFNEAAAPFQVLDPQKRPLPMPPRDPLAKFVRVSVPNPEPGPYEFVLDGSKSYAIRAELWPAQAELISPLGRQPLEADAAIVVRAVGDTGLPLPIDPQQVTRAEFILTGPDGREQVLPARAEAGARFAAPWRTAQPGSYALAVTVEATHAGSRHTLFARSPVQPAIEVSTERPFYLSLIEPDPQSRVIDFPPIDDLAIGVTLVDSNGAAVDPVANGLGAPERWLSAVPVDASGAALADPIALDYDRAQAAWRGTIPVNADWTRGDGWFSPKQVFLRFEPAQKRLGADRTLGGLLLPSAAIDRRIGGDAFSVGPIEVSWPAWLRWSLFALLFIGLVGGLAFLIWQLLRALIVRSLDDPRKGRLELRIFDQDRDPHLLNAHRFVVQGLLWLNKDRQIRAEIAGKQVVIEKFRYARSWQSRSRARARIVYRWPGQAKDAKTEIYAEGPARPLAAQTHASYSVALGYRK